MADLNLLADFQQAMVRRNVSIIEFAESNEYIGKPLYPRQRVLLKTIFLEELSGPEEDILSEWIASSNTGGEVQISPDIRKRVAWCREQGYPHFRTVQLVGGRRSGKGHVTGVAIARKVFDLIQLDDPGAHYGVDPDKDIYIPIVAAKEDQAKMHQYGDAQAAIAACKAMQKYIKRIREEGLSVYTPSDLRKEAELRARGIDVVRDMAKVRVVPFASSADTLRGSASIMYVFDEFAHIMSGESRRSGEEVWAAAIPSLAQFGKDALVFVNSSPYSKVGKFFELWEDAMKLDEAGEPSFMNHLMLRMPSWEMYRDWETDKRFKGPVITYDLVKDEEEQDPDKFKVEYRAMWAETEQAFLQPDKVDRMFEGEFGGRLLTTQHGGIAGFLYKGHGDPSSTGANFGVALGHVELVDEVDKETGTILPKVPHVVFDLIDAFYPKDFENGAIDWLVVMETLMGYISNFRPYEFTFDQFDAPPAIAMLNQEIQNRRISGCRVRQVTATYAQNRRRWDNFKAALYLGRVHAPNPSSQLNQRSMALCREELKFLRETNTGSGVGKVDKQTSGPIQTKDMADCVAEVVDALIGHTLNPAYHHLGSTHIERGAEHGFRIGPNPFAKFYNGRNTPPKPGAGRMPTRAGYRGGRRGK